MNRPGLLLASIALVLFLAGGVALAAVINGTAGDDTLYGTNRVDTIDGLGGNDTVYGRGLGDTLWGGSGTDVLKGQAGFDTIHGEDGNDKLYGAVGDDELRGDDGADILTGNDGNDRLYDRTGSTLRDSFNCGAGQDVVQSDPGDFVSTTCETVNGDGGVALMPDLGLGRVTNIKITTGPTTGTQWPKCPVEKCLRFDSIIANVGAGNFEVNGRRSQAQADAGEDMREVTQRIYDSNGGFSDRSTNGASFFYSGDGHEHWHVRDLEHYQLFALDAGGNVVGQALREGVKTGFCIYDNWRWGSTTGAVYPDCEPRNPGALRVTMGLSVGMADEYGYGLPTQNIDVSGLPNGDYRLHLTADDSNWFLEENENNNVTWVDLNITGNVVTPEEYGPSVPCVTQDANYCGGPV